MPGPTSPNPSRACAAGSGECIGVSGKARGQCGAPCAIGLRGTYDVLRLKRRQRVSRVAARSASAYPLMHRKCGDLQGGRMTTPRQLTYTLLLALVSIPTQADPSQVTLDLTGVITSVDSPPTDHT